MTEKLYDAIANVLKIPSSTISDDSGPETIKTWDSFNTLLILEELESAYDVKFSLDEVVNFKTVGDIKQSLKKHGGIN